MACGARRVADTSTQTHILYGVPPNIFHILYLAGTYHYTGTGAAVDVVLDIDDNEDKISNMAIKMRYYHCYELIILFWFDWIMFVWIIYRSKCQCTQYTQRSIALAHRTQQYSVWPISSSRLILFRFTVWLLLWVTSLLKVGAPKKANVST